MLQLLQAPPADYIVRPVFATREDGYRYAAPDFLEHPIQAPASIAQSVQVQNGDLFLALDLAANLLPLHQAQLLRWKRAGVKLHVLVYDLLPLLHPQWFTPRTTRNFDRWTRWLAIYADSTICISQTVKAELHAWLSARFSLPPNNLPANAIVLGANINSSAPSTGLPSNAHKLLAYLRSTPAVLMVGTLEPRKGYDQALAAFEKLWKQNYPSPVLVIVGRAGWKTENLQKYLRTHPEMEKRLFWLERVSDEYLGKLYSACSGVLLASHAEGFGLPLIEAMQHGKPVLARDIPVFHEFQITGIEYFNGDTPSDLAEAVAKWIFTSERIDLPTSSLPTWELSAIQLLRCLGFGNQP
jgi:glycosyltransferase involved in cell wall biosynthesis